MRLCLLLALALVGPLPMAEATTASARREAEDSSFLNETEPACGYEGDILLSHPMSIGIDDKYYILGKTMLEAAHMSLDQINLWPSCGLKIDGKNYSLTLQTYDDESSKEKTALIGKKIVNMTDFMLAGYSSSLTGLLTPIAQENGKLCITAGSSHTDVHANKSLVFGMLPPSDSFLDNAFKALAPKGAKTVAYLDEVGIGTCDGTQGLAEKYGMKFLGSATLPDSAPLEMFEGVARNMSKLNPDVMFTCIRSSLDKWTKAKRAVNWTPKAQVYTIVFGTPEFEAALGTDLPYVMGVAAWDRALPPIPDGATGWTPRDFDAEFLKFAFRRPAYQHTAQSAAISVLVQALERVGTFENLTDRAQEVLATSYFPTVFGNVSFDINGQSAAPSLLLQYDANNTLHVMMPANLKSTDFELVYPLPSWETRDCIALSDCNRTGGVCNFVKGTCDCPEPSLSIGSGPDAMCKEAIPKGSSTNYAIVVAIPIVVIVLVVAALFFYFQKVRGENDSVWQVKKDELVFADPPEIIGRGTFGLVLLAEYRGTQVAVKRVLPPNSNTKGAKQNAGRNSQHSFDADQDDEETAPQKKSGFSSGISLVSGGSEGSKSKATAISSGFYSKKASAVHRKLKQDFVKEMRYLSKLRHPCITTVMGAVISPNEDPMLIMEYMDHGSLSDILLNETIFLEGEIILPMLRDITQGCRFLHTANPQVVHGDLKAANILVDCRFRAKVADFGLSQKKQMGATGTPYWMAPELLSGESCNTSASDVYSFGIILYEVFSRKEPYDDEEDYKEVLRQVADPKINKRPPIPKEMPSQLAAMFSDCIVRNSNERPTFEELDKRLKRIDVETAAPTEQPGSSHFAARTTISLFDIFPRHIAEALQDGKQVEAEHKECVTIFFSDIIGFTTLSSTLDPRKVANMLDRLYSKFDQLSHKHDIFKVETIGDAYMAVTNLVKDQCDDHAKRIAEFAVEAVQAANETLVDTDDPEKGYVNIRVGFHSGAVVADVVGSRNPRYCLFGDSVNTASRMESNSEKNRIHCSKDAAYLVQKQNCQYHVKSRGVINVKGKGEMHTYWINEGDGTEQVSQPEVKTAALPKLADTMPETALPKP